VVNDLSRLGRNTADLAGIVKTLRDRDQITLQYVSPMTEPDNAFAALSCHCHG